ncbi:MAG TPA: hypothetical protein VE757_07450 [Gaiellaceae bacterium]|nr:hypothetical protein [Gaiellaceae bacterium]
MRSRRAAALVVLAATAAGCGSSSRQHVRALPAGGPPDTIRVALAGLLWPLDPERAKTRDEITVGRMLFATPLRTGPGGQLRPGLCSTSWRHEGTLWRLRCSHAGAIASQLRRSGFEPGSWARKGMLMIRTPEPDIPYRLTELRAAPPGVPGPFRLISASPTRIVVERNGVRVDLRKLAPYIALKRFRAGKLDEAPVPLGDIRAARLDPELSTAVRVRRLLAVDSVVFSRSLPLSLRRVYRATADRADYQALVPEFEAPPAERLGERGQPSASKAAIALRNAKKRIPGLPKVAVRFAAPRDPTLAYGLDLLVASWRDLGLGAVVGGGDSSFARIAAPYPRPSALEAFGRANSLAPIAWVADARLVSPRLKGWAEDELGNVDYARVRFRGSSPSP